MNKRCFLGRFFRAIIFHFDVDKTKFWSHWSGNSILQNSSIDHIHSQIDYGYNTYKFTGRSNFIRILDYQAPMDL